jgi:hypothetical protein
MTDTKQPEALRLADASELLANQAQTDEEKRSIIVRFFDDNAKELRRLHEVNAELLEALKVLKKCYVNSVQRWDTYEYNKATVAIRKAEESK